MSKRDRKAFLSGDTNDLGTAAEVVAGTEHRPTEKAATEGSWLRGMTSGLRPQTSPNNPIGAMQEVIQRRLENAGPEVEAIKAKLEAGETIVELSPDIIDPSFISDRMEITDAEVDDLAEQIKDRGQLIPILVRPHPEREGRYQVAFGHRRLRALAKLGQNVRAVIKKLTDAELVVAQGQENNARLDLSFIEKARFAAELEQQGYDRVTICASLAVTENNLSTMISIANRIPKDIISGIGKAPGIGRPRWSELLTILKEKDKVKRAIAFVKTDEFRSASSDDRFVALQAHLTKKQPSEAISRMPQLQTYLNDSFGRRRVSINTTETRCTIQIDKRDDPEFSDFIVRKLEDICREYDASKQAAE
ncbi:plasmid partitioning protein RepB [Microvirga subterranea]|uniref:ParB family chromosome partitioning protein n=1 Tax=Microvirga subterranea TaxID=186651 RepID=A0A370H4Z4_9HYPH|nr:plasmid partitioning protein RepB [Microvirga subterranea]RDI51351.1 ParB family chromosome partitioning protein [Microvirga subterranea]